MDHVAKDGAAAVPSRSLKYFKKRKQIRLVFRFFYCFPIGPVASSVWVSHRSDGESDGR